MKKFVINFMSSFQLVEASWGKTPCQDRLPSVQSCPARGMFLTRPPEFVRVNVAPPFLVKLFGQQFRTFYEIFDSRFWPEQKLSYLVPSGQ